MKRDSRAYCLSCQELLGQPIPVMLGRFYTNCPECGEHYFITEETATYINHLRKKEEN